MYIRLPYIITDVAGVGRTGDRATPVDILLEHSDDEARSALRLFLAQDLGLQVVGTIENGQRFCWRRGRMLDATQGLAPRCLSR